MKNDLQLCAQAAQALLLALFEVDDDRLAGATLQEVVPAPDAGRLCARLTVANSLEVEPARAALAELAGRLRRAIAAAIHRSRAPELAFVVRLQLPGAPR